MEPSLVYVPRLLDIASRLEKKSCFLFGPRQTGKTTMIRQTLPQERVYNLLLNDVFNALSRRPSLLREENTTPGQLVVIDEIQKLPALLDEVHALMEERQMRFLLTGSSARKLRRGGVNLLGGRARLLSLHPLVSAELKDLDLARALNHGLIPSIYFSDSPDLDLASYVGTYLREEIAAEGLARNLPAFGRFLEVAALCNTSIINHSKIASDAQVARTTVQEYFRILIDTLIAYELPAWRRSRKRKPLATAKLYFFDAGVARHLRNQGWIKERSPSFGEAFETYLFHELRSYLDYRGSGSLAYWRSTSNFEVDFILDDRVAIETKAAQTVSDSELKGLRALREENLLEKFLVVSLVPRRRLVDGITIYPWREFLEELWAHRLG